MDRRHRKCVGSNHDYLSLFFFSLSLSFSLFLFFSLSLSFSLFLSLSLSFSLFLSLALALTLSLFIALNYSFLYLLLHFMVVFNSISIQAHIISFSKIFSVSLLTPLLPASSVLYIDSVLFLFFCCINCPILPPPPLLERWDAVLQKRLTWAFFVLQLSTLVCCQPTYSILACFVSYIHVCTTLPSRFVISTFTPIFIEIFFVLPPLPEVPSRQDFLSFLSGPIFGYFGHSAGETFASADSISRYAVKYIKKQNNKTIKYKTSLISLLENTPPTYWNISVVLLKFELTNSWN